MKETFEHFRKMGSGVSLKAVMLLMAVVLLPAHAFQRARGHRTQFLTTLFFLCHIGDERLCLR
jgi:hypothetical protein